MKLILSLFALLCLMTTLTIESGPVAAQEDAIKFEDKKWKITSVGDHTGRHLGFITFNNGQLEGQSTCNLYSAVYELKPDQAIKINRVAVSQLICKAGNKMQIEEDYIAGLEAVSHYKFEDDTLILLKSDKSEIARFK